MLAKTCPFELFGERDGFKDNVLQDIICVVKCVYMIALLYGLK